jgi:hypothetical protein
MTPVIPAALPGLAAPGAVTTAGPRHAAPGRDRPGIWLPAAAVGLVALAAAAAVVSFTAQYHLVYAARHLALAAGLEAAIPDAAALVFACLGVALALHGRRAVRARMLNISSAGASVFMNVIAAAPGWRDVAVWAMPPAAYALASDTLIGVVRTSVLARQHGPGALAGEVTVLAALGGLLLWLLRLGMAPKSTLTGFRAWVLEECPVAPGRHAAVLTSLAGRAAGAGTARAVHSSPESHSTVSPAEGGPRGATARPRSSISRSGTKTARFLALVADQHGPLAAVPLDSVGGICAALAPLADLNAGAARTALRRAVLAAQNGARP